jgi:hypothetical protein
VISNLPPRPVYSFFHELTQHLEDPVTESAQLKKQHRRVVHTYTRKMSCFAAGAGQAEVSDNIECKFLWTVLTKKVLTNILALLHISIATKIEGDGMKCCTSPEGTASNGAMVDEWKTEHDLEWSVNYLAYYPSILLEALRNQRETSFRIVCARAEIRIGYILTVSQKYYRFSQLFLWQLFQKCYAYYWYDLLD